MRSEPEIIAESQLPRARVPAPVWGLLVYLGAITIFGKGPTYLIYPPVFWGELVMLSLLVWIFGRGLVAGELPLDRAGPLSIPVVGFMVLGAILTVRDLPRGGAATLRDAAIWYYASFFFIGAFISRDEKLSDWLWEKLQLVWLGAFAWCVVNLLCQFRLANMSPNLPWRGVPVLSGSGSENVQHMMLAVSLIFMNTARLQKLRIPRNILLLLAIFAAALFLMLKGRGVKLAFMMGLVTAFLATCGQRPPVFPSRKLFVLGVIALVSMAAVALILGPMGLLTLFRLDRFKGIAGEAMSGSAYWRWEWWSAIVEAVHRKNPLFGLGFGFSLGEVYPELWGNELRDWPVRSPHNYNMSVFGRMGYTGLVLWASILAVGLGGILLRLRTVRIHGVRYTLERRKELAFWAIMLGTTWASASVNVLMEGPVLGIWFWFALGFATGRSRGPDGLEPISEPAEQAYDEGERARSAPHR